MVHSETQCMTEYFDIKIILIFTYITQMEPEFSQYNQILSFSINLGFYLDPGILLFLSHSTFLTAELL